MTIYGCGLKTGAALKITIVCLTSINTKLYCLPEILIRLNMCSLGSTYKM